ncbi:hypothetical protein Tco_1410882, partial [Tanacetum coccineum]
PSALKYLFHTRKDAKQRWLDGSLLLQELMYLVVIDTKGAENYAADHLSHQIIRRCVFGQKLLKSSTLVMKDHGGHHSANITAREWYFDAGTDISEITRKQVKNGQARTRESEEYKKKPKIQSRSQEKSSLSTVSYEESTQRDGFCANYSQKEEQHVTSKNDHDNLKLEDADGISSLPNTEIFEHLALTGGVTTVWKRKLMEFQVGDKVMLKVSPWKGVVRFGKRGKLNPGEAAISLVKVRLELQDRSCVHVGTLKTNSRRNIPHLFTRPPPLYVLHRKALRTRMFKGGKSITPCFKSLTTSLNSYYLFLVSYAFACNFMN